MERLKNAADRFKNYMAMTFCSCLSNVPSFVLVILAAILLMLLVATIPLAFAFTYMSSESSISVLSKTNGVLYRQDSSLFPSENTTFRDTHSIFNAKSVLPPEIDTCKGFGFSCTNEPVRSFSFLNK